MMSYIIVGIVVLVVLLLFVEITRRMKSQVRVINEEKSEIQEETRMTAQMAVFDAPNDSIYLLAISEELGLFYYRLIQGGKAHRMKLNLANLTDVSFLVNGQRQKYDIESAQANLTNKATDASATILSNFPPEIMRSIDNMEMQISYRSDAGGEQVLTLNLYHAKNTRQKPKCTTILKNSLWWWCYIRLSAMHSKHSLQMMENSRSF